MCIGRRYSTELQTNQPGTPLRSWLLTLKKGKKAVNKTLLVFLHLPPPVCNILAVSDSKAVVNMKQ